MRTRPHNNEVLYPDEPVVTVTPEDIRGLKLAAGKNPRQRMRLCAHPGTQDRLHEMLIVLGKEAYIRPHKHLNKSESFHLLEGRLDVVLFEEDGRIHRVIHMGDYSSGLCFYYRMAEARYHGLVTRSDQLVMHETTNGPFNPADTLFAPWAPGEDDPAACTAFLKNLATLVLAK